jgi:peptidoglycan/LPS O-acetylase OafA/YrhL
MSSTELQHEVSSQPHATARGNNFNFLRFVFASMVIWSHCPEIQYNDRSREFLTNLFGTLSFGELAVDSFFLLSGFLIVKSWVSNPHITSYLKSRALRIYPGFVAASLISAFVVGPLFSDPLYFQHLHWAAFLKGLVLLQSPVVPPVFPNTFNTLVNASMWTISYEFICYLLTLGFGVVIGFKRRVLWLAFFLTCATLVIVTPYVGHGHGPLYNPIIRLSLMFSAGGCFFLYGQALLNKKPALVVSFLMWCLLMSVNNTVAELGTATFWGYLILSFAKRRANKLAWFNRLPDVSYGVYLYAWPLTKILLDYQPDVGRISLILQTWLLSIMAGTLSWYLIEERFLALKKPRLAVS